MEGMHSPDWRILAEGNKAAGILAASAVGPVSGIPKDQAQFECIDQPNPHQTNDGV